MGLISSREKGLPKNSGGGEKLPQQQHQQHEAPVVEGKAVAEEKKVDTDTGEYVGPEMVVGGDDAKQQAGGPLLSRVASREEKDRVVAKNNHVPAVLRQTRGKARKGKGKPAAVKALGGGGGKIKDGGGGGETIDKPAKTSGLGKGKRIRSGWRRQDDCGQAEANVSFLLLLRVFPLYLPLRMVARSGFMHGQIKREFGTALIVCQIARAPLLFRRCWLFLL